ncbi:hypothetical protein N1851_029858 [Merluccius polli]|uniref:Uncharacterized protein n=1 Tax=Merluccius polli TaxID=89951 RepID=A0AA47M6L3_MERPO|nr:hypothetical protein N1851_029858 [Merluccius polli]
MAAPCTNLARSALLRAGVRLLPGRLHWAQKQPIRGAPVCVEAGRRHRPLHLAHGPAPSSTRTGPPPAADPPRGDRKTAEDEEMDDGPEYIPRRKAKNPMVKVGYAWIIGLPSGILAFILAKREVDKNRLKQLKVRQRMKRSNEEDYEGSRYRNRGDDSLNVDR